MDAQQVYTVVNAAAKQAFGESAVTAINTATFIALGDKVLKSDTDTDAFNSALSDVIGRTIISVRVYNGDNDPMVRKPFEFGAALRKIYVEVGDAQENNSWNIGKESYNPKFAPIMKPKVAQHLFDKISTYEFGVSIPDDLWFTAFHNEMEMAALISGIFVAQETRMKLSMEHLNNLVRASFIARKLQTNKPIVACDLLATYKAETGSEITWKQALRDKEFIRWSNMTIGMFVDRLVKPSRLFNEASYLRHTPKDLQVLTVLSNYAKASDVYLESDTYHDDLVKLPYYNTVPFWQGTGEDYSFEQVSKISVILSTEANAQPFELSGVIALLSDYEAMGTTIDKPRSPTERNNHDEYTNYYTKANRGYFNDMSENGIVFYIGGVGDEEEPDEPDET